MRVATTNTFSMNWAELQAPSWEVAPRLLGCLLVRELNGHRLVGRIVETEAYDQTDAASHSYRGRTPRTDVMFGPPGHLYVYFTYGMHYCMNVVTGRKEEGSAGLLRAGEPVGGLEALRRGRTAAADTNLLRGPARWTTAFEVDLRLNGSDLIRGDQIWLERGPGLPAGAIAAGPRIGIRHAADVPWRFTETASPWLSRGPATTPSRPRAS